MSEQTNMNDQEDYSTNRERFPKPRTFPTKWSYSEENSEQVETSMSASTPLSKGAHSKPATMDGETDSQTSYGTKMESFPQPRTLPKRWSLTETE
jgi:hypothetical protein